MSEKKATPKRAPAQAEVPGTAQSAAERRSVEGQLRALIDQFAPVHLRLLTTVRKWLQKRLPTAHEVVYEYRDFLVISYSATVHGYDGVLGIRADEAGVKLYFNSAKELPDPEKLLKGSGGQARWIALEGASTLAQAPILTLVDEAIARSRVPFASDGRGSVLMSPSSAKKASKSSLNKSKE